MTSTLENYYFTYSEPQGGPYGRAMLSLLRGHQRFSEWGKHAPTVDGVCVAMYWRHKQVKYITGVWTEFMLLLTYLWW